MDESDAQRHADDGLVSATVAISTSLRNLADAVEALAQQPGRYRSDEDEHVGDALMTGMEAATRELLLESMPVLRLAAGDVLFRQGDAGEALYLVEQGTVDVMISAPSGEQSSRQRRVQTFITGMFFGEMALFDRGPRTGTVVARNQVRLRVLHRNLVTRLKQESPSDYAYLLEAIVRELSRRVRYSAGILRSELFQQPDSSH